MESAASFSIGMGPIPDLISPRYGPIERSAFRAPHGVPLLVDRSVADFVTEARPPPGVTPRMFKRGDDRRLHDFTDPRGSAVVDTFAAPSLTYPEPISCEAFHGPSEVQAAFMRSPPTTGVRVLIARQAAGDPSWTAIAWLRPRSVGRHVMFHSLPPGLLAGAPILVRVELMFSWPVAILEQSGQQEVELPWLFLAVP